MKYCIGCNNEKPITEFHKKGNGYRSRCRVCINAKVREIYHSNREREVERVVTRKRKLREENYRKILEIKKLFGCKDCGYANPIALQFDHISDNKVNNVATLAYQGYSWDSIQNEIDKCEVVCANCHLIRTSVRANRMHWYV